MVRPAPRFVDICGCGAELHYSQKEIETGVREQVRRKGDVILLAVKGDPVSYWVPRHYIALHGIRGEDAAFLASLYNWDTEIEP